jgi:hypothetical protein
MGQHGKSMKRYFRMKGYQHAKSHALRLGKETSGNQMKEKELVFEKHKFDIMHS